MNSEESESVVEKSGTTDEVIRVVHKVTIDNFSDYIEDEFWSDALFDGTDYLTKQFYSYLELSSVSKVKYKLSILDDDGKCRFEKVECNVVDEVGKYVWKCEVDRKCLEYDDKMIQTGEVTVCCEIIIIPKMYEKLISKNKEIKSENILRIDCVDIDKSGNIRVVEEILKAKPRVIDSLAHKWTIDNFRCFYRDEWTIDQIESNKFYLSSNKEHKFHLSLYPNGDRDEFKNNLSIYLFHSSPVNVYANVRCKISIIDEKGDKANTRGYQYKFRREQVDGNGFGDYVSFSNLNELLHNDKIIFFCEVIEDGNGQIEDNTSKITEVSESHFNTKPQVIDSIAHRWIIENFSYFYKDEWIESIESNKLYSNSNKKHQFHLEFFPNGDRDECRNNLSIFLFHSSADNIDVNVRCEISIIDKKGEKRNTKGLQNKFNDKQNKGFVRYISISELLDHSNELLSVDTLTLLCEVQLIGDGKAEDNSSSMVEVSESHFNANLRVIDSLAHKWTIDNFRYFYRDEWSIDKIESDKFHSSSNKEQQFQLSLYPNGHRDESRNNISIFLNHSSPDNVDVNVRLEISIIDEKGEKCNTKSFQIIFTDKQNAKGFSKYIPVSQLLDHLNGLLSDDTLTLWCEIQILDFKVKHSTTKLDPIESVLQSILQLNQSRDSVHLSKCAHKWTIHNFACALTDESSEEELYSCRFFSSELKDFSFYLKLFLKGHDKDSRNYVSLYFYVDLLKRMLLTFRWIIHVVDANGNKLKSIDSELSVDGSKICFINKFISHDELHQYLNDNALRLYCEIEMIRNWCNTELSTTKKEEYFGYLSKLKPSKNEVTKTVENAKAKKIQFEYIWEIENCSRMSDTEPSSVFTSLPTSSYIESPPFSPPNLSTINQHRFYHRMYPNGEDEKSKDYVSMFLRIDTFEDRQVTCKFKISLIDYFGCKFNIKKGKIRYNDNNSWGLSKYISHCDLFNQTNALITDNKLKVHCEIEFLDEEEIQENKNTVEETNEDSKPANISIIKSHSALTPTQSITQVTLHTHHWTIDNFGIYFQSIKDESSYIESSKFSPAYDDQLQLVLKLRPKINTNQFQIYFEMKCSQKSVSFQVPLGQVHFSVLDENDRKCYTKTLNIGDRNGYFKINWSDIQLNLNYIDQLRLLFKYDLISHYSSPTEMSHLDQFSLDQFTSPWQVKRLCHVPTHSRALTSIPVESCHFEWSIHDYASQQGSIQSQPYRLGQLEFYLKVYSQQQNRILIYLCLKKSVEKEIKMCMKISILDKDGHKTSTKDVFKILTNADFEYECSEFEISEDVIQEDNQLKIFCEFNLLEEPSCSSVFVQPTPKVLPNLNALLTNRQPSDLVLQFPDGKQLHAHRSILSARSPVFFGMFEHDTSEAQHGQVDITDVDMEVCELMLRYICTGLVQLDQASTLDLMIAADKYQITELKDLCEDWLCTNLSIESVTNCLIWSDQICATKLKTKSISFFHRNAIAISQTNAIKKISKNRPDLMQELYLDSTRKFLNNKTETNLIEGEEDEEEEDISVL